MSPLETFFTCSFVSTFAVALIATWFNYLPTLISLYRVFIHRWSQSSPDTYITSEPKFRVINH